jgi:hypothetical protein
MTREPNPDFCTESLRNSVAMNLNIPIERFLTPNSSERICETTRGVGLYSHCHLWGFRLPLSKLAADICHTVDVAPSQLNASAWCYINSFEALFYLYKDRFVNCPIKEPTLGLFLHYYSFQVEKCWVKCVRRKWVLFETISNPGKWQNGFFFLVPDSAGLTAPGSPPVPTRWNNKEVRLPGRRVLTEDERKALYIIESIKEGTNFYYKT